MPRQASEFRQEQIKQAVLEIIHSDGLKNLSTRNLAHKVGVSEGAIFKHFPTKQDIIVSIIKDVQTEFIGELKKVSESDEEPATRLKSFICTTVRYLANNKGITMLLFSEATHHNDKNLKKDLNFIFNSQKSFFSKIIRDGISQGIWDESIPVENLASLYMGIPISLNIELILSAGKFQKNNFCDRMLVLLLKILDK